MKRNVWIFLMMIMFFVLKGDGKQKLKVDFSLAGYEKNPSIKLVSNKLKAPLRIAAIPERRKGTFYFRTSKGLQWVKGRPEMKDFENDKHIIKWKINGRNVNLIIKKDNNDFILEFKAQPEKDIFGWGLNIGAMEGEYFTGLFERTVDGDQDNSWKPGLTEAMNLRGQKIDMIIKPTLSMYAPFYISSRGYGMHVYGTWPGKYDMCKEIDDIVQVYFDGPDFKCRIYTAENPAEIVKSHTIEAGPPILPPKWTFSHWRWRDNHTNEDTYFDGSKVNAPYNSMLVEDILMMEALDIPYGLYWVDRPWAKGPDGYDDFEWDQERFPNPEKMIQWLHKKDKKFLLWIAPWVMGDMAETAKKKNYDLYVNNDGDRVLIDFTNPVARRWWQKNGPEKMMRMGVDAFKLDRSEEIVPESRNQRAYDGRTCRELRNDYPVEYLKATYQAAKNVRDEDFVLMPRAGYTGSSKYGVFWGGDIGSPQEGLRCAIIALLRSSVIGYPIWGSDIGGYWQGELDREVTARWLAFGAFCPLMEVGPTEDKGLWELDEEPTYDPRLLATWRLYAKLHTQLMDYSYNEAKKAHKTGMPIARPLFLNYPEQEEAWTNWQTYLYGPDILVSPIWKKGKRKQKLYLPAGDTWIDAWNRNKEYKGGQKITVEAPLYKIPIFIRKGSSVDLGNLNDLYQESLEIAKNKPSMAELEKAADFSIDR